MLPNSATVAFLSKTLNSCSLLLPSPTCHLSITSSKHAMQSSLNHHKLSIIDASLKNITFDGENKNIYYKSHALISYVCATTGACATPFCFFPSEGGVNVTGASCMANTAAGASCCRALFLATAAATSFGMYFCIPNMQSPLSPDKLYGHASLPSA